MTVLATLNITSSTTFSGGSSQTLTGRAISNATFDASAGTIIAITGQYRLYNLSDDTITLGIRIMSGATVLAAADSGGTYQTFIGPIGPNDASYTTGGTAQPLPSPYDNFTFDYVNTGASQAEWDAATADMQQTYDQNMGGDSGYFYFLGNWLSLVIQNTNRDVICPTGTVNVRGREAAVWRGYNVGDPLLALVAQDGVNASTGPSGWSLESSQNNSTVRLELWSKTAAASNDFGWTPGSGQSLHVIPLVAPNYTYSTLGETYNTGNSTTPNSTAPTIVKKYVTVWGGFVIDQPAGNLTLGSSVSTSVFEADDDPVLGAAAGFYQLPYEAWSTTGLYVATEELSSGEAFGVPNSFIMPGGTPSSAIRNYNQYYNGSAWSSEGTLNTGVYDHGACGSYSAGMVVGGWTGSNSTLTQEWNGASYSTGGALTTGQRENSVAGVANDAMSAGGRATGSSTTATEEYNGTSWSTSTAMNTERAATNFIAGVSTNDILAAGGYGLSDSLDAAESFNGTAWSTEGTLLWTHFRGGCVGAGVNDTAVFLGARNNSTLSDIHARYDGVSWATATSPADARNYPMSTGVNGSNLVASGGDAASERNARILVSGPQAFEHNAEVAGNWVAATVKIEIDDPRTVTGTTAAISVTGNHAQVGLNVLATPGAIAVDGSSVVIQGDASYPVAFSTTGVIAGTTEQLVVSGTPATVNKSRPVTGAAEAITVTGVQGTIGKSRDVSGSEAISVVGTQATIFKGINRTVACTSGAIALTENAATVRRDRLVGSATEAIQFGPNTAQVSKATARDVTCSTEAILVAANQAVVDQARPITGQGAISVIGTAATVVKDNYTTNAQGAISVVGTPATVTKVPSRTVVCQTEEITLKAVSGGYPRSDWYLRSVTFYPGEAIGNGPGDSRSSQDAEELFGVGNGDFNDADTMLLSGGKHGSTSLIHPFVPTATRFGNIYYDKEVPLYGNSTLKFDGAGDYIRWSILGGNFSNDDHFKIVGWFKPASLSVEQTLWTTRAVGINTGGMTLNLETSGELTLRCYNDAGTLTTDSSGVTPTGAVQAGVWHYILVGLSNDLTTYGIGFGTYGTEGTYITHKTFAKGGSAGTNGFVPCYIGRGLDGDEKYFTGHVGDFAVSPTRWGTDSAVGTPRFPMSWYQNNAFNNRQWLETNNYWGGSSEYRADMGGWVSGSQIRNSDADNLAMVALHRLTTSWTIEMMVEVSAAANLLDNTAGSGLAAGIVSNVTADGTVTLDIRRFNTTACANITTGAGAFTFDTPQKLIYTYNKSLNQFAIRVQGTIEGSGTTTNPPDTVSNANDFLRILKNNDGLVRDHAIHYSDLYGVQSATVTYLVPMARTGRIVEKERWVRCTSGAIVVVGNDATITSNPARNVACSSGTVVVYGVPATVTTTNPRLVEGTTEAITVGPNTATVGKTRDAIGQPEAIEVASTQATIRKDRAVTCQTEQITLTENPALVEKGVDRDVMGLTGAIIVTGSGAVNRARDVAGQTEAVTVTGSANITTTRQVVGQIEAILVAGQQAGVEKSRAVSGQTEAIGVVTNQALIGRGRLIAGTTAQITIVGSGSVDRERPVVATTGQVVVVGNHATIQKALYGVVTGETEAVIITGNTARVSKMTIQNPLPRYDRIGVRLLPLGADSNPLLTEKDGVSVLTGGGLTLVPTSGTNE